MSPGGQLSATGAPVLTQDEVLRSCERSDRIMRAVLGDTPDRTALRVAPFLVLLLIAAAVASVIN